MKIKKNAPLQGSVRGYIREISVAMFLQIQTDNYIQTLTTKDCNGPQTNMPKNVGSIISKNNNVDILNSASRILQC